MGRIFITVATDWLQNNGPSIAELSITRHTKWQAQAQVILQIRNLIVQALRTHQYDVLTPPDGEELSTLRWINQQARPGDVALALAPTAALNATLQGITAFYIAHNAKRKAQADRLLQAYLRRMPQLSNHGAKPDTQTPLGYLPSCRHVAIPSLLLAIAALPETEDPSQPRQLQVHCQETALGIAEGLVGWSQSIAASIDLDRHEARGAELLVGSEPSALVTIHINGSTYEDVGVEINGNAYIPIDLLDQLGVDLPPEDAVHRLQHHHVVYVRAIDLHASRLAVDWNPSTEVLSLRSSLPVDLEQLDQIMGRGHASDVQMIMFLKSQGAADLVAFSELPKLYRQEGAIEGVNYDLAFAQMCVETNFLRFDRGIPPEHNNFAGLGSVGGSAIAAVFADPRLGVRAHMQHLKAYASTAPLAQSLIDPRFHLIRRGVAPTLAQLSGRWSADRQYGAKVRAVLCRLYESAGFL